MLNAKWNYSGFIGILGTIYMCAKKTFHVEYLKPLNESKNLIIGITQQYLEPFDCVQMNE